MSSSAQGQQPAASVVVWWPTVDVLPELPERWPVLGFTRRRQSAGVLRIVVELALAICDHTPLLGERQVHDFRDV
jgi:hypothetical protein